MGTSLPIVRSCIGSSSPIVRSGMGAVMPEYSSVCIRPVAAMGVLVSFVNGLPFARSVTVIGNLFLDLSLHRVTYRQNRLCIGLPIIVRSVPSLGHPLSNLSLKGVRGHHLLFVSASAVFIVCVHECTQKYFIHVSFVIINVLI